MLIADPVDRARIDPGLVERVLGLALAETEIAVLLAEPAARLRSAPPATQLGRETGNAPTFEPDQSQGAGQGLQPPNGEVRSHVMRHSLGVAMLDRDASLEEVGEVLRHRSRRTTTTYAPYDFRALRSIARPWPVPGEIR